MHCHNIAHMDHSQSKQHTLRCHHSLAWNSGQSSRPTIVRHPTTIISDKINIFSFPPHLLSYNARTGQGPAKKGWSSKQVWNLEVEVVTFTLNPHKSTILTSKVFWPNAWDFQKKADEMNLGGRNAIKYLAGASEGMRPEGLKVPSTFLGQVRRGRVQPAHTIIRT